MSRSNDGSAGNVLTLSAAPVATPPYLISFWFYPNVVDATQCLLSLYKAADSTRRVAIQLESDATVTLNAYDGGAADTVIAAGSATAETWNHVLIRVLSATSRSISLNGGAIATTTTSRNPVPDTMKLGADHANANAINGRIAEFGFWRANIEYRGGNDTANWNAALAELYTALYSPALYQKTHLLCYMKLLGSASPETDSFGAFTATITGSMPQAAHPTISYETVYVSQGDAVNNTGTLSVVPKLGFYRGAGQTGVSRVPALETWMSARPTYMLDFFPYGNWSVFHSSGDWSTFSWAANTATAHSVIPVFSIPLTVWGTSLAQVAAGSNDSDFDHAAAYLVTKNLSSSIIRFGWEFNLGSFPWSALGHTADYINAFRRVVGIFRNHSANFKFDWCPVCGYGQLDAETCYPGDSYVDIIGIDVYNQTWVEPPTQVNRWNDILTNGGRGLEWARAFAASHSKLESFPEWGTGTRADGHGGGDDTYYMGNMIDWIDAGGGNVQYHCYWDYPAADFNGSISNGSQPDSELVFLARYGG